MSIPTEERTHPTPPPPEAPRRSRGFTRRRFLGGAGSLAIAAAAASVDRLVLGSSGSAGGLPGFGSTVAERVHRFRSRPDLRPPRLEAMGVAGERGHLLIGPGSEYTITQQGPMIIDNHGQPVWFRPLTGKQWATNVRVTTFEGRPVIAWWEGVMIPTGFGKGEAVIVDASYREVARVRAANGLSMDMHEFQLTPEDTALFTCYPRALTMDLRSVGGPRDGRVLESVIQEIDVRSGRLINEWRSLDHIPIGESQKPYSKPWDYLHINSVEVLPDGNLLASGRHTWALYKLDRRTGRVIWRLGGKRSDFSFDDAQFSWQHDARVHRGGSEITVFDNGSDGPQTTESESRALLLGIDERRRTVTTKQAFRHPQPISASSMGSVQALHGGNVLVGWGKASNLSEYAPDGQLVQDLRLPNDLYSYRVFRQTWSGVPAEPPALAVERRPGGATVYVSWNGDTHTTHWQLHGGHRPASLRRIRRVHRRGFETAIPISGPVPRFLAVSAHGAGGRRIGASAPIRA